VTVAAFESSIPLSPKPQNPQRNSPKALEGSMERYGKIWKDMERYGKIGSPSKSLSLGSLGWALTLPGGIGSSSFDLAILVETC
jgi:hypothetical protein